MNNAQRDLLAKALADISKGIFIGVLLAGATDKLFSTKRAWVFCSLFFFI